jgi:hypothetical protein
MGSSNSHTYGGMFVQFEKPYYYPGDMVKGTVYLNMISGFETKGLEVSIEVLEHASFYEEVLQTTSASTGTHMNSNLDTGMSSGMHMQSSSGHQGGAFSMKVSSSHTESHNNKVTSHTESHMSTNTGLKMNTNMNTGMNMNTHQTNNQVSSTLRVLRTGNNCLFKNSTLMYTWNNNLISVGQYAYPFSFYIPQHLPGSFEYYDADCTSYVKYIVTARTLSWAGLNDIISSSLLLVRTPPTIFSYPTNLSDTKNITTWCFFSKGTATINASYPKNHFTPDESVQVICTLNNTRCQLNATAIVLQLFQQIHLKSSDLVAHNKYLSRCISESRQTGNFVSSLFNFRPLDKKS